MNWMILPLQRYADFSGRSRRMEYWMFSLLITLAMVVMLGMVVLTMVSGSGSGETEMSPLGVVFLILFVVAALGLIVPSLAVQVRRLHDQDKSGWWVLIGLVPYIGGLVMLVFMVIPGTRGDNRFGPDPKEQFGYDAY